MQACFCIGPRFQTRHRMRFAAFQLPSPTCCAAYRVRVVLVTENDGCVRQSFYAGPADGRCAEGILLWTTIENFGECCCSATNANVDSTTKAPSADGSDSTQGLAPLAGGASA